MNSTDNFLESVVKEHSRKLKHWYDLLREIMPDYFFRTFSARQLEDILPLLFNIESETGIQRIEREDSIVFIYLKSEEYNILTTSRMMREYCIASVTVHESREKIIINKVPRTLVIELFTLEDRALYGGEPCFSKKELAAAYRKMFNKVPPELDEVYNRINWKNVSDLSFDRLIDRFHWAFGTQSMNSINVGIEKIGHHELKLTLARPRSASEGGFYYKIIEAVNLAGFNIERTYFRDMTYQNDPEDFDHMPVTVATLYLTSPKGVTLKSARITEMLENLKVLNWTNLLDLFHREFVSKNLISIRDGNLLRAAFEFIHTQLAFIDKNAYNHADIPRFMAIYPEIMVDAVRYFYKRFDPAVSRDQKKISTFERRIEKKIAAINTGMHEKDEMVKTVFSCLLDFFRNILKCNFFSEHKSSLAFRMDPAFMAHYDGLSEAYKKSFPADRPYGVFFFYRENAVGFQVRFSDIARGGWRTVIPQISSNALEYSDAYEFARDEIFREVFVLAHTQHLKNKDIYEGGSKMITLLKPVGESSNQAVMFETQRSICAAFVSLINYDRHGKLKDRNIVDYLGRKEIIEIGPDERMFDVMLSWISNYAAEAGYTLGSGLISGKPDQGINHKEFGVTSFGVHQFFLRTLRELNIDPCKDEFSVKISGGPYGDVAGNEMKLLLEKNGNSYVYKNARIVAITDGPAAAYDPDGLDREELATLVLTKNLDAFNPEKLRADGAYMIFSKPVPTEEGDRYRLVSRKNGKTMEKLISRDEYMNYFQNNIYNYADVFIPCGGRPSTLDISNWDHYCPDGVNSSRAIVEGANSFITPDARIKLQDAGILIVKDASANKCGVITSSYEIMSGLMLDKDEFKAEKQELVKEIMLKLKNHAVREAEWLFANYKTAICHMTELTDVLSRRINEKNEVISDYLTKHPGLLDEKVILEHLPSIFAKKYRDRIERLPAEYKKAIASVELATRIIYTQSGDLEQEIKKAMQK
ncbi:MAG: NAD-glutamate dehydrogenase domain-containing protein [Victivallales bacterium]